MGKLDEFGAFAEESSEMTPTYSFKALFDYCKGIGKTPRN